MYHPKIQAILNDRALIRALDDHQLGVLQAVLEARLNDEAAGAEPIAASAAADRQAAPEAQSADEALDRMDKFQALRAGLPELPRDFDNVNEDGRVVCFVDGACSGNPGPGGWSVVVDGGPEASGGEDETTNNRMEMMAALKALLIVPIGRPVEIVSDSKLVVETMSGRWKPKANGDLWKLLFEAAVGRDIEWTWVKGHKGHKGNERADMLAQMESQSRRKA